jgi:hypothetical protein
MTDKFLSSVDANDMIKVAIYFLNRYTDAHGLPPGSQNRTDFKDFCRWFEKDCENWNVESLSDEVGIGVTAASQWLNIPGKANVLQLQNLWPYMLCSGRELPVPIRAIDVTCMIRFEDGTVVPLNYSTHAALVGKKLEDADVADMVLHHVHTIAGKIFAEPLENLRKRCEPHTKGALTPAMFQFLERLIGGKVSLITEEEVQSYRNLLRLLRMIADEPPPEVLAQARRNDEK